MTSRDLSRFRDTFMDEGVSRREMPHHCNTPQREQRVFLSKSGYIVIGVLIFVVATSIQIVIL